MHLGLRLALGGALAALVLTASCTSSKGRISYNNIPDCPGFQITKPTFTITPTAGSENLGGNNKVSWEAGAVASPQTFTVFELMIGTSKIAGIRVEPPAGSSAFTARVRLQLNYASCGFGNMDLKMAKGESGSWQEVPSTQNKQDMFVEAEVTSFSDWAIAD